MPNNKDDAIPCMERLKAACQTLLTRKSVKHAKVAASAKLTIFTTIGSILPTTAYRYDPTVVYIAAQTEAALQFITKILEVLPSSHVTLVDFPPNCILGHQDKIRRLNALAYWQKSSLVLASSHRDAGTEFYRNFVNGLTNTSFQYWDSPQRHT